MATKTFVVAVLGLSVVAGPALAKPQSTTPSLKPNTVAAPDTPDKTS